MKKIKKSISNCQNSKIDFDQLSRIKGGDDSHDIFISVGSEALYTDDIEPER